MKRLLGKLSEIAALTEENFSSVRVTEGGSGNELPSLTEH